MKRFQLCMGAENETKLDTGLAAWSHDAMMFSGDRFDGPRICLLIFICCWFTHETPQRYAFSLRIDLLANVM